MYIENEDRNRLDPPEEPREEDHPLMEDYDRWVDEEEA